MAISFPSSTIADSSKSTTRPIRASTRPSVTTTSTDRNQSFTYDLTGNLTARFDQVTGSDPANYTYNIDPASNRMTAIASLGIGFSLDEVGNRTGDGRISYLYNARGRLYRVNIINAALTQTFNYLVNGLNQRVRKTGPSSVVPQGTRIFVYDDGGRLLGEYDNLGRARTEHVWLENRPVAAITYTYVSSNLTPATTTVSYVETDHLGTPRLVTNASRQARWSWVSAPYGDTLANENPAALGVYPYNLRFAGQYFDKETNHHYNWHRDYESTTGRYVQSDPIGLAGDINTYRYALNHPTKYTDPNGLMPLGVAIGVGARVIGGRAAVGAIGAGARSLLGPTAGGIAACVLAGVCSMSDSGSDSGARSESGAKADSGRLERCEAECDEKYDNDQRLCEAWWKTTGRNPGAYRVCMDRARENYISCYQDCKKECN
jgi:RHS repeat-associated protein